MGRAGLYVLFWVDGGLPRLSSGKLLRSRCVRTVVKCLKVLISNLIEPAWTFTPLSLELSSHDASCAYKCSLGTASFRDRWGIVCQGKWALDKHRKLMGTADICEPSTAVAYIVGLGSPFKVKKLDSNYLPLTVWDYLTALLHWVRSGTKNDYLILMFELIACSPCFFRIGAYLEWLIN